MKQIHPPILIAEIGNCHEGNLDTALTMIDLAAECGADLVKFQAGHAEDFARNETEVNFYRKYDLGSSGYKQLLFHGNKIGIPVFFSIWSQDYEFLRQFEQYHKIAARQLSEKSVFKHDSRTTFISIPYRTRNLRKYGITQSIPMHCVVEYPAKYAHLEYLPVLSRQLKCKVGYSDHTIGIDACIRAVQEYGAIAIEKHFTIAHDYGELRDHKLSASPVELKYLATKIK